MTKFLDRAAAEDWIRAALASSGRSGDVQSIEVAKERPWATVLRVGAGGETVWFKACRPVQAFEPRLTIELSRRWPDRVASVLAIHEARGWLLTADAGEPVATFGNPPELWLRVLPRYAEIQRGEAARVADHLDHGVPDLRLASLPAGFEQLLAGDLPLEPSEVDRLRHFAARFEVLCGELASAAPPAASIQHDDLHLRSVFVRGDEIRILDWGDASVGHPFASLVVTFRWLERHNGLDPRDPWFARLRDAYLEPWGRGLVASFELAQKVGAVAHCLGWLRQRAAMPAADRPAFDVEFAMVLRRALRVIDEPPGRRP